MELSARLVREWPAEKGLRALIAGSGKDRNQKAVKVSAGSIASGELNRTAMGAWIVSEQPIFRAYATNTAALRGNGSLCFPQNNLVLSENGGDFSMQRFVPSRVAC
jgi:hypothetical protein